MVTASTRPQDSRRRLSQTPSVYPKRFAMSQPVKSARVSRTLEPDCSRPICPSKPSQPCPPVAAVADSAHAPGQAHQPDKPYFGLCLLSGRSACAKLMDGRHSTHDPSISRLTCRVIRYSQPAGGLAAQIPTTFQTAPDAKSAY